MAEPERLEARLADLAAVVAWPPTPRLSPAVRERIARRRRRRRLALALLAAALAVAVAGGAATAAYVELRGATIQRVPRLPSPSGSPPGGTVGERLELGKRQDSLDAAASAAGFRPVVPVALGRPDEVYFRADPGLVTLVYRPRPGLPATGDPDAAVLVMEARASVDRRSFGKLSAPETQVQPVAVNGGAGFWISGAPHAFFFYATGDRVDSLRLAGDALIWNQGGLVVRIESGLDERRALDIAGTVR